MRDWNLLHYPALAQQRRQRHRLRTTAAGVLLGLVLSWAGGQWLEWALAGVQAEQRTWQARLAEAQQRTQVQRAHERQQQAWALQMQPLHQVLLEQQTWAAWHQALQQEAPRGSWQLLRLQLEPGRLELQGLSPDVRSLGLARERLAAQLRLDWPLDSPPRVPGPAAPQGVAAAAHGLKLHSVTSASAVLPKSGQAGREAVAVEFVLQAPWPVAAPSVNGADKGRLPADAKGRP